MKLIILKKVKTRKMKILKNKELIIYLKQFIKKMEEYYTLECVILFGSQARGDFKPYSDIDLIIVGDFKEKFIERGKYFHEKHNYIIGLDAFCYTHEEFDNMFNKGTVSILDAIDEGICILGSAFFNHYKDKLIRLKKIGLKKDPPVWILPKSMFLD